jgi:hypothetical protein
MKLFSCNFVQLAYLISVHRANIYFDFLGDKLSGEEITLYKGIYQKNNLIWRGIDGPSQNICTTFPSLYFYARLSRVVTQEMIKKMLGT